MMMPLVSTPEISSMVSVTHDFTLEHLQAKHVWRHQKEEKLHEWHMSIKECYCSNQFFSQSVPQSNATKDNASVLPREKGRKICSTTDIKTGLRTMTLRCQRANLAASTGRQQPKKPNYCPPWWFFSRVFSMAWPVSSKWENNLFLRRKVISA